MRPWNVPHLADQRAAQAAALARDRYESTDGWFYLSATIGSVALAAFLAAAIPGHGWLPFLLVGIPALGGFLGHFRSGDIPQGQYALSQLAWLVGVGVAAALTDGADSFLIPFLCVYCLGFFSRLRPRQAAAYTWASFGLAAIPILALDWAGFVESPWLLGSTAVGLVSLTLFGGQMAAGELRHRGEATVDQLTGLLNRRGLQERLGELREQALVIGDDTSLAVIASDLDRFKHVNDTYGHARGDDVLRDVAYLMRKELRRFELTYRMGGEEFLIVLPGHDAPAALAVSEKIRAAVERERPGGVDVTISMGVAVRRAADMDIEQLLLSADAAVYRAKRAGRNRVVLASEVADGRAGLPGAAATTDYSI